MRVARAEAAKVLKLAPERYVFVTSATLIPHGKEAIRDEFCGLATRLGRHHGSRWPQQSPGTTSGDREAALQAMAGERGRRTTRLTPCQHEAHTLTPAACPHAAGRLGEQCNLGKRRDSLSPRAVNQRSQGTFWTVRKVEGSSIVTTIPKTPSKLPTSCFGMRFGRQTTRRFRTFCAAF